VLALDPQRLALDRWRRSIPKIWRSIAKILQRQKIAETKQKQKNKNFYTDSILCTKWTLWTQYTVITELN
jgi:hypothetical protein